PPSRGRAEAGEIHVHPEDPRDEGHRQQDHADHGEHAQDVVLAVVDRGLVRVLERLDDLLVVVEDVPDALGRVDDVVEVELELLRQEPLDVALEQPQGRSLGLDDLAVADDLLLDVRDIADDLVGAALEDVVLERVELVPDLVEDWEAVVEEIVEDVVEQVARALAEELRAELEILMTAAEKPRHRQELDVRQGDEVVLADERVELGCVQALDALVVDREVQDDEEVAVVAVLVDLRALAPRQHVLEIERMPPEASLKQLGLLERGGVEMNPGQAVGGELLDARLRACEDFPVARPGPRSLDARQAWHWY